MEVVCSGNLSYRGIERCSRSRTTVSPGLGIPSDGVNGRRSPTQHPVRGISSIALRTHSHTNG